MKKPQKEKKVPTSKSKCTLILCTKQIPEKNKKKNKCKQRNKRRIFKNKQNATMRKKKKGKKNLWRSLVFLGLKGVDGDDKFGNMARRAIGRWRLKRARHQCGTFH